MLFQTGGNYLIENAFSISNVILFLQNLFLSSLYFSRNSHFSKQSMRDVLEFLVLKIKETNLLSGRWTGGGEAQLDMQKHDVHYHKLLFFVRNDATLLSHLTVFTRSIIHNQFFCLHVFIPFNF